MAGTKTGTKAAKATDKPKKTQSNVGAPSQLKQSSRKGKRAWRKNIDIEDIEEHLEDVRQQEREFGYVSFNTLNINRNLRHFRTALHKQTDDQLFQVDTKGDEKRMRPLNYQNPIPDSFYPFQSEKLFQKSHTPA
jgi:nucleolar protein 53